MKGAPLEDGCSNGSLLGHDGSGMRVIAGVPGGMRLRWAVLECGLAGAKPVSVNGHR